eukprot:scaffold150431_cov65-Attheya_sp.AAC.3
MAKTREEMATYDKECAMVIMVMQHTHKVPAPQTQMMMQTHSDSLSDTAHDDGESLSDTAHVDDNGEEETPDLPYSKKICESLNMGMAPTQPLLVWNHWKCLVQCLGLAKSVIML